MFDLGLYLIALRLKSVIMEEISFLFILIFEFL